MRLNLPHKLKCPTCQGWGYYLISGEWTPCVVCFGLGQLTEPEKEYQERLALADKATAMGL